MKRTIYLPEDLDQRLSDYLKAYPDQTLSSLVQEALETKLAGKDISKLLTLAGIVPNAISSSDHPAEDRLTIHTARDV